MSVINPKDQSGYLDEVANKVPLICQDNDAPQTKRLAYIGTDNYKAGRAAGRLVKEALGDAGGTVVIFVGSLEPRKDPLTAIEGFESGRAVTL